MIPRLACLGCLALAAGAARADGLPPRTVELPLVPVTVDPRQGQPRLPATPPGTVVVSPGETKALMVSADNINRIVTPFAAPDIITTAPDTFTIRENIIYAAPAAGAPISLYLTEKGDESRAINPILSPNPKIASREIRLVMAGAAGSTPPAGSPRQASDWERDQPYESALTEILALLAKGNVPQGYDLATAADAGAAPRCAVAAPMRVDFRGGQHLTGGQLEIWIGRASNTGPGEALLAETACAGDAEVVAVALWPSPRLPPGGLAEVFVVRRLPSPGQQGSPRPSLIEVRHGAD